MNSKSLIISVLLFMSLPVPASEADERVAIVARLYKDFAWEVVVSQPTSPFFIDQPKAVLEQYLTPELTALILEDRECQKRTKELCRIDTPPLWVGNDPGAEGLTVTAGRGDDVVVRFTYPGNGTKLEKTLKVVRVGGQWRIDDFQFESRSLKDHLKKPQ